MSRFLTRTTVYILLEKNGKILMFKRKNTNWYDGFYNMPCGHIDGHETLRQAAVREVKEEVGVDVDLNDLEFVQMVNRLSSSDDGYYEYTEAYFKTTKWRGEPFMPEGELGEDMDWFNLDQLPEKTLPYVQDAIKSILNGNYYCESDWNKNE